MTSINIVGILERKFAIYVILTVKKYPGCTKTDVLGMTNRHTKFARINELIDCGIIDADDEKRQHQTIKLYLTPKGQEIAALLEQIYYIGETMVYKPQTVTGEEMIDKTL